MTRGMTPADLFRIQWVSDACLSPDGQLVAFTVTRLDEEADGILVVRKRHRPQSRAK